MGRKGRVCRVRMRRLLFSGIFFLAGLGVLSAEEVDYEETLSLKDGTAEWNVAVSFFDTRNISLENRYLASSLPLKIYTTILNYQTHIFSEEERLKYAEKIIENARQTVLKEAADLRKSFDDLDFEVFKPSILNARQTKEWDLLQKRDELNKKIRFLTEFKPQDIEINPERAIVVLRESDSSELFAPVTDKQKQFAEEKKADLLIFGQLEEMAGYMYYRVGAYSSVLDRIVFEAEGGGSPDIIEGQIAGHLNDLITVIVGHEWADLTVSVLPITASIQIGEKYSGSGVYRNNSIVPGTYVMTIEAPGYVGEEVELVLNPKETKTLSVALIRNTVPPVVVNTYPPGADIYLSSLWVGATPFLVENGGLNEPLMLKKDGYLDLVSALTPDGNTNLDFVLKSTAFNRDEYLKQKRKDFYFNIAGLAISIPMTLLSSGYQTRFLNSIPDATEDNAVQRQQIIFGYKSMAMLFTVSIVLDAMMAAGLIIDMIDYIKVYDNM